MKGSCLSYISNFLKKHAQHPDKLMKPQDTFSYIVHEPKKNMIVDTFVPFKP